MNQEKQKVIRVLKPAQKTKKVSPIYYGIAGAAVGIAITSVLLFSVLGKDSNIEAHSTDVQNNQPSVQAQTSAEIDKTPTSTQPVTTTQDNIQNEDDEGAHDGFDIPQPKANELNGIFTHNKTKPQVQAAQAPANNNPFGNIHGQIKADKAQVSLPNTDSKTDPVTTKTLSAQTKAPASSNSTSGKTVAAAKGTVTHKPDKPLSESNKAEQKSNVTILAQAKTKEKEAEVDTPNATVQISVTRSVKE